MTVGPATAYYARLMSDERLPLYIDALRLARNGVQLHGQLPLAPMARLANALSGTDGEAEVELQFDVDVERRSVVRVRVRANVALTCQRCLEPVDYAIDSERVLAMVGSDAEAERLPDMYDPLVVGTEPLFLADLIEDELILSLPIVARHSDKACLPANPEGKDNTASAGSANPFAVLAGLKKH